LATVKIQAVHHATQLIIFSEPDAFKHAINRSLSAHQLGLDFQRLHVLVKEQFAASFPHSLLVGPDITRPKKKTMTYLNECVSYI
jgi:hypothetical protein